jgi:hypothetical protein
LTIPVLTKKTILLVSPQSWGKMFVSKHHYAVELARQGNTVYFLNPPDENKTSSKTIIIEPSGVHENLFFIHHRLWFPYNIKFHFISLFHILMKPHVKNIARQIGKPLDIIWSFDLGHLYPFSFFPNSLKIFHPVDEPTTRTAVNSARGAQVIFSVTHEILDKFRQFRVPKYFINHGVADYFLEPLAIDKEKQNHLVHVGISGNLLREDIDRTILLQIINENPGIVFECWGSYQLRQSNIGGKDDESVKTFILALQQQPNVILHGVVDAVALAKELRRMDAFLICYNINKDQSRGTNYHKVMEYISTGKVIISNNITTYSDKPFLVQMVSERDHNKALPALFSTVISDLQTYNKEEWQKARVAFATENFYTIQIQKIGELIGTL